MQDVFGIQYAFLRVSLIMILDEYFVISILAAFFWNSLFFSALQKKNTIVRNTVILWAKRGWGDSEFLCQDYNRLKGREPCCSLELLVHSLAQSTVAGVWIYWHPPCTSVNQSFTCDYEPALSGPVIPSHLSYWSSMGEELKPDLLKLDGNMKNNFTCALAAFLL